jgi:2-isopropylmalate synthase
MQKQRVSIFDTTLRDGEQSPGCSMNLNEKVRMATKLQSLGVDIIEAGFPIASDGDFAAVKAVAARCREVTVAALCRTAELDVARAAEALAGASHPRIHTFVATSDIHLEHKLKKSRREVIEMTRDAVRMARDYAEEVEFSAEDEAIRNTCARCSTRRSRQELACSMFRIQSVTQHQMSLRV